jgi:hypothetical protein
MPQAKLATARVSGTIAEFVQPHRCRDDVTWHLSLNLILHWLVLKDGVETGKGIPGRQRAEDNGIPNTIFLKGVIRA